MMTCLALATGFLCRVAAPVSPISIIPQPIRVIPASGYFRSVPSYRFEGLDSSNRAWLRGAAKELVQTSGFTRRGDLCFRIDPNVHAEEGYRLEVSPRRIEVRAKSAHGLYWGLQTLRQLHTDQGYRCASIEDEPRFSWRGVLLDEGRHFMGVPFVKRLIDALGTYKFNVLHWHLTEDQGWRIEIRSHPELTRIGAWRTEPDGVRTGGFYTQDQIREVVRYAASRNIVIEPEIEMPGHASAAIASIPDLGCTRQKIAVPSTWGVFQDVYCAGRESTFDFLEQVIGEVAPLFPGRFFHIGGDEVPIAHWQECPDCQARIKAQGLKDEHELQSYFVRRVQKILAARGKTLVGWDEIMDGGLAPGAVVQVWREQSKAKEALAAGNRIILSPSSHCYLNRNAGELPMEQVYGYSPLEGVTKPDLVQGIEATLWSENITTSNCMQMLMPRGLAIAELAWSVRPSSYTSFKSRVDLQRSFMERNGIAYGPENMRIASYAVTGDPSRRIAKLVPTFGMPGVEMRYTLDGSKPTMRSARSKGPLSWPIGRTLSVAAATKEALVEVARVFPTVSHSALGKPAAFLTPVSPTYNQPGFAGLTDGIMGSSDFHDGRWLGWDGTDMSVSLDLGTEIVIYELALHCLQDVPSWIFMPRSVSFEVSSDGTSWSLAGVRTNWTPDTERNSVQAWYSVKPSGLLRARYIRVRAENYGPLPKWHLGYGGRAWVFCDELAVN